MKIVAIIQARMNSSRFYGKILEPIESKPLLEHIIDRLKCLLISDKRTQPTFLDEIVIATTQNEADLKVVELAKKNNITAFTGSENDVLGRFIMAATSVNADHILRVTGDNPLIDIHMLPKMISYHLQKSADYSYVEGLPYGAGTEIVSFETLKKIACLTTKSRDREHVTIYIREHPEQFIIHKIIAEKELYYPDYRITVDEKKDLQLIRKIYKLLYQEGKIIDLREVIKLAYPLKK
ncbi:MAG: glycosyltransferase family protein [bacterium]